MTKKTTDFVNHLVNDYYRRLSTGIPDIEKDQISEQIEGELQNFIAENFLSKKQIKILGDIFEDPNNKVTEAMHRDKTILRKMQTAVEFDTEDKKGLGLIFDQLLNKDESEACYEFFIHLNSIQSQIRTEVTKIIPKVDDNNKVEDPSTNKLKVREFEGKKVFEIYGGLLREGGNGDQGFKDQVESEISQFEMGQLPIILGGTFETIIANPHDAKQDVHSYFYHGFRDAFRKYMIDYASQGRAADNGAIRTAFEKLKHDLNDIDPSVKIVEFEEFMDKIRAAV